MIRRHLQIVLKLHTAFNYWPVSALTSDRIILDALCSTLGTIITSYIRRGEDIPVCFATNAPNDSLLTLWRHSQATLSQQWPIATEK